MREPISKIVVNNDDNNIDVAFYFEDSDEQFSAGEFEPGSLTRRELEKIEYLICDYNTECYT